jgi:hypothetical protein
MEQTERRYRSDREELMRVMGGLDSGVLVPGEQGNRAFGRGEAIGVGVARGADGSVLADKLKKRRRGEDGEPAQDVDMPPPPPVKKKVDPMFGECPRRSSRSRLMVNLPCSSMLHLLRRTKQHYSGSAPTGSTHDFSKHASTCLPPIHALANAKTPPGDQDERALVPNVYLDRPTGHAHKRQCRRARKGHSFCGRVGRDETARRSGRGRSENVESAAGWYRANASGRCIRFDRRTGRFKWLSWRGGSDAEIGGRTRDDRIGSKEREYEPPLCE